MKKNFKEIAKIVNSRLIWETQDKNGWFIRFYYEGKDFILSQVFETQKEMMGYSKVLRGMSADEFKKLLISAIDAQQIRDGK